MRRLLYFILCCCILVGIVGCGSSNKLGGDEPLSNPSEVVFKIGVGGKSCVPVNLVIYEDNTYELFTTYKACRQGDVCNLMLVYTKSIKGKTSYDFMKIIDEGNIEKDKSHDMDNLPEYEIYMGDSYVEKGYSYYYSIEKGENNKYLDEFLGEIDVDLRTCAIPSYEK